MESPSITASHKALLQHERQRRVVALCLLAVEDQALLREAHHDAHEGNEGDVQQAEVDGVDPVEHRVAVALDVCARVRVRVR